MNNIKVGDRVRRINSAHAGAPVGTVGVVSRVDATDKSIDVKYTRKNGKTEVCNWMVENAELVTEAVRVNPNITFKTISGERSRTYTFPDGSTFRVENVTGLCVRPTSHRLETRDGRKLIVPGKFIAIEIEADGWSA